MTRREEVEKRKPPRLTLYLLFYLLISLFGYTIYMMRENEPSSSSLYPPKLHINEGGKKCFAKNSIWSDLKNAQGNVTHIEDFFQLGGATAKNIIQFNSLNYSAIWKPQLPKSGGHKDSSFFEVVYFHLDCLLHLQRTPPAVSFNLPYSSLFFSLTEASKKFYEDRNVNWAELRANGAVPGVAQYFLRDVKHLNFLVEKMGKRIRKIFEYFGLGNFILGRNDYAIREFSQRDMIDYIAGNWDRGHNRFYMIDPITKDTVLVYLDHNHFKLKKKQRPFSLVHCKFWYHNIHRLRKLLNKGIEKLIKKSLKKEEIKDLGLEGKFKNPLKRMDKRTSDFLDHVDQCVDQYGFESVFGFPIEDIPLHKKLQEEEDEDNELL